MFLGFAVIKTFNFEQRDSIDRHFMVECEACCFLMGMFYD